MSTYIGIDPGGIDSFGWCVIEAPSTGDVSIIAAGTCSDSKQAIGEIAHSIPSNPLAAGIDAPMYWSRSKERLSDRIIRKMVTINGGHSATVGLVNSLQGACLVQGILSDIDLRHRWPEIRITESHPKALLLVWPPILRLVERFKFNTEHERDAFIGAYAAWQYVDSVGIPPTSNLNTYSYARNNPLGYIDPLGLYSWSEYWQNVVQNYTETNNAIPGSGLLPTGVGIATAGTTARSLGGITFWGALEFAGTSKFGGALLFAGLNSGINTLSVGGAWQFGILVGSMINATPTGSCGRTLRDTVSNFY